MIEIDLVHKYEIPQLRDLAEHTFRTAYQKDNDPENFETYCQEYFSIEKINSEWSSPDAGFWFAKIENQPVGYFKLKFDQPQKDLNLQKTTKLERIYVLEGFQNRRIGSAMLDAAEAFSKARNQEFLWLSVWKKNPPGIRFYEKNGYDIFGIEIFVVGNDEQEDWLMGKKLV